MQVINYHMNLLTLQNFQIHVPMLAGLLGKLLFKQKNYCDRTPPHYFQRSYPLLQAQFLTSAHFEHLLLFLLFTFSQVRLRTMLRFVFADSALHLQI